MADSKRTVLITGCSDGGLGAALAVAFHNAGLHVYATARNTSKMGGLEALGIETHQLDVLSDESIVGMVNKIPSLDILVNNAGAGYSMAFSDMSLLKAKKLFDLNVWSCLAVTQAFLPSLLKSKGIIVNHTSIASVFGLPFESAYNASKAAMAAFSENFRLELKPFGIIVVDLKTGFVPSNFFKNRYDATKTEHMMPANSIYQPAKETIEKVYTGEAFGESGSSPRDWANGVVQDLLQKQPPARIWRGQNAVLVRISTIVPHGLLDGDIKKRVGLDVLERNLKQ